MFGQYQLIRAGHIGASEEVVNRSDQLTLGWPESSNLVAPPPSNETERANSLFLSLLLAVVAGFDWVLPTPRTGRDFRASERGSWVQKGGVFVVRFDVGIRHAPRGEVLENWEGQRCSINCCEPKKPDRSEEH